MTQPPPLSFHLAGFGPLPCATSPEIRTNWSMNLSAHVESLNHWNTLNVRSLIQLPPPKTKYPRADAIAVARELCNLLRPCCEHLIVAGSLRRMKREVGDVELLFVPKREQSGLFTDVTDDLAAQLINSLVPSILTKRPNLKGIFAWGPKNKLAIHQASGIPVDLFSVPSDCWWNSVVVRTGGKASNLLLTNAALRRGWSFEAYGSGFQKLGSDEHHTSTSESDVFQFVGMRYLPPQDRP